MELGIKHFQLLGERKNMLMKVGDDDDEVDYDRKEDKVTKQPRCYSD